MSASGTPSSGLAVVELENVNVDLGGRSILRDMTFSVLAGEIAGLIGANGAGKTTIFRTILGLQATASGSVRVAHPRGDAHAAVGYVPQKVLLDPDIPLRARDVVALGLDGHRLGIPLRRRARSEIVDEMLVAVGGEHLADARVGQLSGGEQQRVLIAHALVARPRLLLLDEPLANLDISNEIEVVDLLAAVAHEHDIAVLVSAHDMNPLLPVMSRVVYVAGGRVASGSVEEIVRSDVLSDLYGRHVDVVRIHNRVFVMAGHEAALDATPGEEWVARVEQAER